MLHYDSRIYEFINRGIAKEFKLFKALNLDDAPYSYYTILQKKIKPEKNDTPKPLRAVFSYLMKLNIESEGGEFSIHYNDEFWAGKFPFIIETLMTILYYDNQILDKKGDVIGLEAIAKNLLIGRELQSQLTLYIQKHIPAKFRGKVQLMVNDIIRVVCAGQQIERACNFYKHWQQEQFDEHPFTNLIKKQVPYDLIEEIKGIIYQVCPELQGKKELFLNKYLERVYLVNAYLFERVTRFILDALEKPIGAEKELIGFARMFGMMHQLMNDTADFVPSYAREETAAKKTTDGLTDLRNGLITLPTLIYLIRNDRVKVVVEHLNRLESQGINAGFNERKCYIEICKSLSIYFAMDVTNKIYSTLLRSRFIIDPWYTHLYIGRRNRFYNHYLSKGECYIKYKKMTGSDL